MWYNLKYNNKRPPLKVKQIMFKYIIFLTFTFVLCANQTITPIPLTMDYDKDKVALGKKLFFDSILSKDGTISCQSCHTLPGSGADTKVFSFGVNTEEGKLNTPTVLNAIFNFSQFWDGRSKTLYHQTLSHIINSLEMQSSIENIIKKLKNSSYKIQFQKLYKDGVTQKNLLDSVVEFEKALITPNSKFDSYLRGDNGALNTQEKRGYKKFKEIGCINCHNGVNIGGNMYQKVGLIIPYKEAFNGRYNVTARERDKQVFKVPTLRNIELSAPYFHNGSIKTLEGAIINMRKHQLGIIANGNDITDIEAFLKTLTGKLPVILKEEAK